MNVPFYSLDYVNRALGDALRESFSDVLDSKWFIRGNRCREFEEAFAAYCGKKACVGVGNGLDALTLMLKASIILGRMAQGDEVIVPANTFVATVLAVRAAGLVPVLVEPDPETCVLDMSRLADACSAKTRAILTVHLYGRLADMPAICEFAKSKGLLVFEDAAQSHGAVFDENNLSSLVPRLMLRPIAFTRRKISAPWAMGVRSLPMTWNLLKWLGPSAIMAPSKNM